MLGAELPKSEVDGAADEAAPLVAAMPPLAIESSVFMPFESVFGTSVNGVDFCCAVDVVAERPLNEEAVPEPPKMLDVEEAEEPVLPKLNGIAAEDEDAELEAPLIVAVAGGLLNKLDPMDAKNK